MISFELTAEQVTLINRFHALSRERLQPYALSRNDGPPGGIDEVFLQTIAGEGLNKFIIPQKYGGSPLDRVTLSLVVEELSYGCAGFASCYLATVHAVSTILIGGTDEQKRLFLPMLLAPGGMVASCLITEEKGGSDTSYCAVTARLDGDRYIINGRKIASINAGEAVFYVGWANTGTKKGTAINAFIIPSGTPGMIFDAYDDKAGLRNTPTASVSFDNVSVPKSALIGLPGSGYILLAQTLDLGRAFFGAVCLGVARAAIEEATSFAKQRVVTNKPIIKNQGISLLLAELLTELEAARLLVWRACRLMDLNMDYSRESSMAKYFASEVAFKASNEGMQILGQKGSRRPSLMSKLQCDALMLRIVEGTNTIQKVIIASQL